MDFICEPSGATDTFVLRFHPNEDFLETLRTFLVEKDIKAALVVCGIGMLVDFELGYFDGKTYQNDVFSEPHELCTMQGTIALKEGSDEIMPHIHATLAGKDHTVVGGHLHKAKVGVLCEMVIQRLNENVMVRRLNKETELWELSLKE